MRHKKKVKKLGRSPSHRKATLSALVCSLIEEKRIKTTITKAKLVRSIAERMVTLGRKGTLAARRLAIKNLTREKPVAKLFTEIAPSFEGRNGGYTRIVKLGRRRSDSSEMVILEWVDMVIPDKKKKKTEPAADKKEAA